MPQPPATTARSAAAALLTLLALLAGVAVTADPGRADALDDTPLTARAHALPRSMTSLVTVEVDSAGAEVVVTHDGEDVGHGPAVRGRFVARLPVVRGDLLKVVVRTQEGESRRTTTSVR